MTATDRSPNGAPFQVGERVSTTFQNRDEHEPLVVLAVYEAYCASGWMVRAGTTPCPTCGHQTDELAVDSGYFRRLTADG